MSSVVVDRPTDTVVRRSRRPQVSTFVKVALVVLVAILPLYLDASLLQAGLFAMAALVAAIGLTVLLGVAGQLSLAHAFFLAVGTYSYAYYASPHVAGPGAEGNGLGIPSVLAAVLAVLTAGLAGLIFSPIASRLRGIYLGVASLALVFIGEFLYENVRVVSGGFNGRGVPDLSVAGFTFAPHNPDLFVLNVPFGRFEKLWELFLVLSVLAYAFARNVLRGRAGRAMQTVRDSEVAAAVMGVDVRATKAGAFVLSSMYAGLGGVMLGLAFTRATPSNYGLNLSIAYLAMVVIGGLGSIGGAACGAIFVNYLPTLLDRYGNSLPFVAPPGSSGYDSGKINALAYGLAVIAVVLFEPGGLAAVGRRILSTFHRAPRRGSTDTPQENA